MEKILRIKEKVFSIREVFYNSNHLGVFKSDFNQNYHGFEIETDQQIIKIGVEDNQKCCERYGCIVTEDDTKEFIGANVLSIEVVDRASIKNFSKIDPLEKSVEDIGGGDIMFVNINTSNGPLQFAAYNIHNGYYGHKAVLVSTQLTKNTNL